jgi:hypothetical protein
MEIVEALPLSLAVKSKTQVKIKEQEKGQSLPIKLPTKLRNFYIKHGYSDIIKDLRMEVFSDVKICFQLWDEFSPKKSLFDLWDFRAAFYRAYKPELHFILLKSGETKIGLLPLWYEDWDKKYFWFGGWWQEDNKFFVRDQIFIPILSEICPKPILLNTISVPACRNMGEASNFVTLIPDDPKYVLDLRGMKILDDYLKKLKKSRRHSLKKDKARIERQNPQIIINNFSDLKYLFKLSSQRCREKGQHSDWDEYPEDKAVFRYVIRMAGKKAGYEIKMITVKIGRKVAGVDLIAVTKDCYYALICGYNVKDFSGIGNYFNTLEIEDALKIGVKKIDFLENNYQWKDRWFQAIPLLKYEG